MIDNWEHRQKAEAYTAGDLHRMLVEDIVANRPPGGPMLKGTRFVVDACQKIAADHRIPLDDAWKNICAEAATLTGRTAVPLA